MSDEAEMDSVAESHPITRETWQAAIVLGYRLAIEQKRCLRLTPGQQKAIINGIRGGSLTPRSSYR